MKGFGRKRGENSPEGRAIFLGPGDPLRKINEEILQAKKSREKIEASIKAGYKRVFSGFKVLFSEGNYEKAFALVGEHIPSDIITEFRRLEGTRPILDSSQNESGSFDSPDTTSVFTDVESDSVDVLEAFPGSSADDSHSLPTLEILMRGLHEEQQKNLFSRVKAVVHNEVVLLIRKHDGVAFASLVDQYSREFPTPDREILKGVFPDDAFDHEEFAQGVVMYLKDRFVSTLNSGHFLVFKDALRAMEDIGMVDIVRRAIKIVYEEATQALIRRFQQRGLEEYKKLEKDFLVYGIPYDKAFVQDQIKLIYEQRQKSSSGG